MRAFKLFSPGISGFWTARPAYMHYLMGLLSNGAVISNLTALSCLAISRLIGSQEPFSSTNELKRTDQTEVLTDFADLCINL